MSVYGIGKIIRRNHQSGSALVEFTIALPVMLFLILAFVDISRALIAQTMLNTAASRALSLAATVPGLDLDSSNSGFVQAKEKVEDLAKSFALSTFLSDEPGSWSFLRLEEEDGTSKTLLFTDPPVGNQKSQRIRVQLEASITPIFPFIPPLELTGFAEGFREPKFASSLPILVDCKGVPVGDLYFNMHCNCPFGEIWDMASRSCICHSNRDRIGDECVCRSGAGFVERDPPANHCLCTKTIDTCPNQLRYYVNQSTCECAVCPFSWHGPTASGTGCECKATTDAGCQQFHPALVRNPNHWCACSCSNTCPPGAHRTNYCDCYCPSNKIENPDGSCTCNPDHPNNETPGSCPAGMHFSTSTCRCVCSGTNSQRVGDTCVCNDGFEDSNGDGNCTCIPCGAGCNQNSQCTCYSPSGWVMRHDNTCVPLECPNYNHDTGECGDGADET